MTHCQRGHELTPENVYLHPDGRSRCRICRNAAKQRYDRKRYHQRRDERRDWNRAYQQRWYEERMSTPEGRWERRSSAIRSKLAVKRREIEAKRQTELCLTFGEILQTAFREVGLDGPVSHQR